MAFAVRAVDCSFIYSPIRVQGEFIALRNTPLMFGSKGNPVDCVEVRNS